MGSFFHRLLGGLSAASVLTGLAFLPPPWGTVAIVAGTLGALATNLKKAVYPDRAIDTQATLGAIPVVTSEGDTPSERGPALKR